jgi:hypothetical protein
LGDFDELETESGNRVRHTCLVGVHMVRACGSKPSVDTKLEKKAQEMQMWKLVLLICLSPLVVALIAALPFLTVFFWCVISATYYGTSPRCW